MSEELRISEILLKKFDETHKDITDIKVGLGTVLSRLEEYKERQDAIDEKVGKIDERLYTIEGEWKVGRLLLWAFGIMGSTWVGLFVKDIYQSIKHA